METVLGPSRTEHESCFLSNTVELKFYLKKHTNRYCVQVEENNLQSPFLGIFPYTLDVKNTGSQQGLLVHDISFPSIAHKHIRYLTLHLHSPTSTQSLQWWEGGEGAARREVKAELKTGRRTTVTPESHWRAAVKGEWARGKDNQLLTIKAHKNLQVTKKVNCSWRRNTVEVPSIAPSETWGSLTPLSVSEIWKISRGWETAVYCCFF